MKKQLISFLLCLSLAIIPAYAHSGRTDGNGGHKDNKNKSGLGSYHYHCGGHPAHLHESGICPYASKDTISVPNIPKSLNVGEETALEWTVTYYSGVSTVTWSSSDPDVLSVSDDGTLQALTQGNVTLTAQLYNGTKSFDISVKPVALKALILESPSETINLGENLQLAATFQPENATDRALTWQTSDPSLATVDDSGQVTALAAGVVTIAAQTDSGKTATMQLTLLEILPETVTLNGETTLTTGETTTLSATVGPENTTNPTLVWASSQPEIASVDENGVVEALAPGTVQISASCGEITSESLTIEVSPEAITTAAIQSDQIGEETTEAPAETPTSPAATLAGVALLCVGGRAIYKRRKK